MHCVACLFFPCLRVLKEVKKVLVFPKIFRFDPGCSIKVAIIVYSLRCSKNFKIFSPITSDEQSAILSECLSVCLISSKTVRCIDIKVGTFDHLLGASVIRGSVTLQHVIIKDNFFNRIFGPRNAIFGLNESQYQTYLLQQILLLYDVT